ncbi:AAA family ATPase [Pyrococcus abyssi]|uniref:ATPase AAA-type core domain-containing protein n=1 Tax=Pyrococcus abyssi (strain GE5 / Orsay) TaxID=272844 RepID=Q9V0J5_PYRAB|nr:ATP/GTP-binding protein [Pyrococcus abyssi]CAB49708.1 Hypothetical protein PAB0539 [Pyrococcus abyssi GE5]CCE70194.1 TPA: hypothetical protein PAB0539 [Pyrococcus abyssi GE5]
MIRNFHIENFKSIGNLNLKCRRINVFIGEPNVGKSNVLEAIGLLSYLGHVGDISDFIRFENISNLFYDNEIGNPIRIKVDDYEVFVRFENGFRVEIGSEIFPFPGRSAVREEFSVFRFYRFKNIKDFPSDFVDYLLPPDGKNLPTILMTRKSIRKMVSDMLAEYGLKLMIRQPERKLEIVKMKEDILITYPYTTLSETFKRIIFYLTAVESSRNAVIAFEEPEAHAFPYYTKFLAERIALNSSNQYFISTHNPYFLLSLIEKTPRKELSVYVTYFKDGETRVKEVSPEKLEEMLQLDIDVFFNLDTFLEENP